jgi:hypothetical protein
MPSSLKVELEVMETRLLRDEREHDFTIVSSQSMRAYAIVSGLMHGEAICGKVFIKQYISISKLENND